MPDEICLLTGDLPLMLWARDRDVSDFSDVRKAQSVLLVIQESYLHDLEVMILVTGSPVLVLFPGFVLRFAL
jgi:hypothetical protein